MELKLNIYEKKEVVKTYTADTYDVMFGTLEDMINAIDFEGIKKGTDAELILAVSKAIPRVFNIIKPLFKDIFDGLTDDEIKQCKVKEMAAVIVKLVIFTMREAGDPEKN